jgi:hypothetical protein
MIGEAEKMLLAGYFEQENAIQVVIEQLKRANTRIVGVILNQVPHSSTLAYRYYPNGYYRQTEDNQTIKSESSKGRLNGIKSFPQKTAEITNKFLRRRKDPLSDDYLFTRTSSSRDSGNKITPPDEKLRVDKIKDGTVIDHIRGGHALEVLQILGITGKEGAIVSLAMNVASSKMGRKELTEVPVASPPTLLVEDKVLTVHDLIKGDVEFRTGLFGDFIIVRPNGMPLYIYTSVVDDIVMKISHIIRADEHLANTPKQILIFEAFGAAVLGMFR